MSIPPPYLKASWMELECYETDGPSGRWQLFLSSCIWQFPSFKIDAAPVFFRLHTGKRPHIYECLYSLCIARLSLAQCCLIQYWTWLHSVAKPANVERPPSIRQCRLLIRSEWIVMHFPSSFRLRFYFGIFPYVMCVYTRRKMVCTLVRCKRQLRPERAIFLRHFSLHRVSPLLLCVGRAYIVAFFLWQP